ncbi:type II toxin-antitoxin system RelE/ParE family toxin [Desulfobacterium sp. N47]|uniref:Type II toxin-antitoxin system mRNA interferase toxin, RelE/StbE family n=1 Tax=uncultured Desulfobacterium sp. TaxID=201089 RepID=E1YJR7_9BACT|nr:hypothetical protein N47_E50330 [uncultured Desulfobacterium sp.]
MIEIAFSSSFKRAFKKIIKGKTELEQRFWQQLEIFTINPFDERLRTHKLSGKLKDLWSFRIEFDTRVIFYFIDNERAMFVDIGKHDAVY